MYFNMIPEARAIQKRNPRVPLRLLIIGFFAWLVGYGFFPDLRYVLATGWFLAFGITLFLVFYKYRGARQSFILSALGASLAVLITYFANSLYIANSLILFSLIGIAALLNKYITIRARWVVLLSLAWLTYDIVLVFFSPHTADAVITAAQSTPFQNMVSLAHFELGSGDVFLILFYTLYFYARHTIKKALLASVVFILPLIALPLLFDKNFFIPYLVFLVPLFLIMHGLYMHRGLLKS